tara:strand:- start:354 stop:578 length:225 start_codon:yes stop_codon:yes gene_type:complete
MESEKKPVKCRNKGCYKRFRNTEALAQHKKDSHGKQEPMPQISADDFSDIYEDLPDGAFFAMAEENGLDYGDFI